MVWILFALTFLGRAEDVKIGGLQRPVEVLRDKWGVPHIYAQTSEDLFFAQGYVTARDRMFQLDLWRRVNTGKLAEILGPQAIARDRIARLVRYRGDWNQEWTAYAPDTRQIVTSFVAGINAYIKSLNGKYSLEFRLAGYAPQPWVPEDCVARIAGLLMTRNLVREVERAIDVREFGAELVQQIKPTEPLIPLRVPAGLDLKLIVPEILKDYSAAIGPSPITLDQGSNNWVVDGTRTVTGKPLLANDPHRPVNIPSLRKTVHLVGPGWNAFGAGEPALPGVALGHNEEVAFGFTIVNIDQQDLFVERLNPANRLEYWHRGAWKKMDVEWQQIAVKGRAPEKAELHYTVHGPVIYEDTANSRAYALKWVGAEPGGAGYLAALSLARAKNWPDFLKAVARYKVPSENLVYADRGGNIGWVASGATPLRKNSDGLFPVPGDSGDYEWNGYLPTDKLPMQYNPARHWIATANHNILPANYPHALGYEWALPFRYQRIAELLTPDRKLSVADFQNIQQDVTSVLARRFQKAIARHVPSGANRAVYDLILKWDAKMTTDSTAATIFEVWMNKLPQALVRGPLAKRMDAEGTMRAIEKLSDPAPLRASLDAALRELENALGADRSQWKWGRVHQIRFVHPLRPGKEHAAKLNLGPVPRPGDGNTVNSTSGTNYMQTNGASYRQIIDLADWDRSVMTNVPGEVGDPESKHYSDLLDEWASGRYHPMLYSRKAVEASTVERINLIPVK